MAWSLVTTRSAFEHRAVVTGADLDELTAGLAAIAAGEPAPAVVTGIAAAGGRVVFVFPGQGGQWAGMGRELAVSSPVFAARLAECGRALARHVDWDLNDVLAGVPGAPGLDRVDVVQPVLWAASRPARHANARPRWIGSRTTWSAPACRAASAVPSVEPSSTTSVSTASKPAMWRGSSARAGPICSASSQAGIWMTSFTARESLAGRAVGSRLLPGGDGPMKTARRLPVVLAIAAAPAFAQGAPLRAVALLPD